MTTAVRPDLRLVPAALAPALDRLDLDDAACAGQAPLHDGEIDGELPTTRNQRHQAAAHLCANCPALTRCRDLIATLPRATTGVWAGLLLDGRGTPQPISPGPEGVRV
ncbi:WhiB family transcriptional regulator [Pseudonocardia nigra]|uniref:WhiB family transcriptional regulator n=1 Tax=Pseudonocardia nigra TaxID=1921578 RepID=UPI001C5DC066|nr:WhiB family transcriptional regulator [Pseudonocardia nigra]